MSHERPQHRQRAPFIVRYSELHFHSRSRSASDCSTVRREAPLLWPLFVPPHPSKRHHRIILLMLFSEGVASFCSFLPPTASCPDTNTRTRSTTGAWFGDGCRGSTLPCCSRWRSPSPWLRSGTIASCPSLRPVRPRNSTLEQSPDMFRGSLRVFWCVSSVNRTVKSLIGELLQLLQPAPATCQRYVLKLCDAEEYLQK